jgi:uncharacterized membrane protein YbaN (DUF454 family)
MPPINNTSDSKWLTWLKTTRISRRTYWAVTFLSVAFLFSAYLTSYLFESFIGLIVIAILVILMIPLGLVLKTLRLNDISPERRAELMKNGPWGSLNNYTAIGYAPSHLEPGSSFDESVKLFQKGGGISKRGKYPITILLSIMVIIAFVMGAYVTWNIIDLYQHGIRTTGYYQSSTYGRGGSDQYSFQDMSGSTHIVSTSFNALSPASQISVIYNLANPDQNAVGTSISWMLGPIFLAFAIMAGIALFAWIKANPLMSNSTT